MTPACPKCGGTRGYLINVRTMGTVVHRGDWTMENERIVNTTDLRAIADKSVRCVECGRRTLLATLRAKQ